MLYIPTPWIRHGQSSPNSGAPFVLTSGQIGNLRRSECRKKTSPGLPTSASEGESAHSVIFWIATLQTFQQQIRLGGGFSNLASAATRRFKSEVESCLAASARQPPLSEEAQRRAGPVAAPLYLWFISLKPPLPSGKLTQLWKIIIFNG